MDVISRIEAWGTLMSVDEVATVVGISPKTIYRYIQRKKIKAVHLPGGDLRLNPIVVADWLRERTR